MAGIKGSGAKISLTNSARETGALPQYLRPAEVPLRTELGNVSEMVGFEFPFPLHYSEPDGAPLLCFSSDTESLRFGFSHPTILAVENHLNHPFAPLSSTTLKVTIVSSHNHPTAILVTFIVRNIPILRSE